ncbi:cytochrome c biogenesis protein CcdA [Mastigocoleus testarum]|uniref:cytochrome c biogenesis protein CcdA n=1 Tax=Mastigocoleus testarum TaxID=996925 RepID=UPI0009E914C3|nr:cytochrome c biogenesis protein CcdA [Mastigocoleus testarum]
MNHRERSHDDKFVASNNLASNSREQNESSSSNSKLSSFSFSKLKSGKLFLPCFLFVGTIIIILFGQQFQDLYFRLEDLVSQIQTPFSQWFEAQNTSSPFILLPLAFVGGLTASISPCILSLLPVNLSYIGTLKIDSRRDALIKAGLFVLGAITVFSLFGLFASFASAVMVEFRGHVNVVVGVVILLMGLSFAGLIRLPLPQKQIDIPVAGPYGAGLTFALVTSPCASPVLFAVLAAAATSGSQVISTVTMVFYAIGYTAVIFLASLFTGLVKQSRNLLSKSDWIIRLGSAALILTGGFYLVTGIQWFI